MTMTNQNGKCDICRKEGVFTTEYSHAIGKNANNEYLDFAYRTYYRNDFSVCSDCEKNNVKGILEKCFEILKAKIEDD